MFDPKSDYALNKMDPEAIVYIDSTGTLVRLTQEDFSSVEEFQRWKVWSDESYHMAEKKGEIFYYHTVSLAAMTEQVNVAQSPEEVLVDFQEKQERKNLRHLLMVGMDSCLTPIQRRRLWLSCVDGLTVRQISQIENVTFKNVAKSIVAAKKKLRKFLGR